MKRIYYRGFKIVYDFHGYWRIYYPDGVVSPLAIANEKVAKKAIDNYLEAQKA